MIFTFDIKVSEFINKLPLLSSIIDTETLEQFEDINENDDFYKELVSEFSDYDNITPSNEQSLSGSSLSKIDNKNILDKGIFKDIKVKKISNNENLFRITLKNGETETITAKKSENGKITINLPPRLKQIQENIKKGISTFKMR